MRSRAKYKRQRLLQAAGIPALAAALLLIVNCCHGSGFGIGGADGSSADRGITRHSAGIITSTAPSAGSSLPCHARAASRSSGARPGNDGSADQEPCPGCNSVPVVQMDGHKTGLERLVSHGFLKGAGPQPGIVAAFGDAQRLTLTAPHANTFRAYWRTLRLNQTGSASVYLINQSFLI